MGRIIEISDEGRAYLPTACLDAVGDEQFLKRFTLEARGSLNVILKQVRLGNSVIVSGSWDDIIRLLATLEARKKELLGYIGDRFASGGLQTHQKGLQTHQERKKGRHFWEEAYSQLSSRLLVMVSVDGLLDTLPPLRVPHLLEFMGDHRHASEGLPIVVPVIAIRKLLAALDQQHFVLALEGGLLAPESVLQPRQPEVYDLFREALLLLRAQVRPELKALDMGCGCGALALLMAQILRDLEVRVWATDILPEALATTRLNVERFVSLGEIQPESIFVTDGGDLYTPVGDQRFDLIAFNPPWANAPARTRLEIARYDNEQRTIRRFLEATPEHLSEDGRVLLFYSDNAGDRAVQALQGYIAAAGLRIQETFFRRIRVARKWEHIYLYDLVAKEN